MDKEELAIKLMEIYREEYNSGYIKNKDSSFIPVQSIEFNAWLKVADYILNKGE